MEEVKGEVDRLAEDGANVVQISQRIGSILYELHQVYLLGNMDMVKGLRVGIQVSCSARDNFPSLG